VDENWQSYRRGMVHGGGRVSCGSPRGSRWSGAAKPRGQKRRKRAVITEAKRARVLRLVKAGKTGNQIAVAAGISLPSVNAIKKKAGLTKARK